MSSTNAEITIKKQDGWVLVLEDKGFVVINKELNSVSELPTYASAYADTQPSADFVGNVSPIRIVDNNETSKLWIRALKNPITVTPNVE